MLSAYFIVFSHCPVELLLDVVAGFNELVEALPATQDSHDGRHRTHERNDKKLDCTHSMTSLAEASPVVWTRTLTAFSL